MAEAILSYLFDKMVSSMSLKYEKNLGKLHWVELNWKSSLKWRYIDAKNYKISLLNSPCMKNVKYDKICNII